METGTITSADGTEISWSRQGSGSPLIIVHSVATSRVATPQPALPGALAEHFTVFTYDRRGTGKSSDNGSYTVEREFDDLTAIINLAGEPADVYGFSSGATLAMLASIGGVPIRRLALLEPPLNTDTDPDFATRSEAQRLLDQDVADARDWFHREIVGIPAEILADFPPPSAEDLHNTRTIVHELTFLPGTNPERFAKVLVPTLLLASDHTADELLEAAQRLEHAIPDSTLKVLPGEWHGVDDHTLTTEIVKFLGS